MSTVTNAVEVPLRRRNGTIRAVALLSPVDADLADGVRWSLDGTYAARCVRDESKPSGKRKVYLHKLVMGDPPQPGLEVDHINLNELDNRRENLRWLTSSEQKRNRRGYKNGAKRTSKYLGVSLFVDPRWGNPKGRWHGQVTVPGKSSSHVGYFDCEREAFDACQRVRAENDLVLAPDPDL